MTLEQQIRDYCKGMEIAINRDGHHPYKKVHFHKTGGKSEGGRYVVIATISINEQAIFKEEFSFGYLPKDGVPQTEDAFRYPENTLPSLSEMTDAENMVLCRMMQSIFMHGIMSAKDNLDRVNSLNVNINP